MRITPAMPDAPKPSPFLRRHYDLPLPVFKEGDDVALQLCGDAGPQEAFEALALQYEQAAALCRTMAGVASWCPQLELAVRTNYIGVRGPSDRLDPLVVEGILQVDGDEADLDQAMVEGVLAEHVFDFFETRGPFTVEDVLREIPKVDGDLEGLNPVWVREVLDRWVTEGSLIHAGDRYQVFSKLVN